MAQTKVKHRSCVWASCEEPFQSRSTATVQFVKEFSTFIMYFMGFFFPVFQAKQEFIRLEMCSGKILFFRKSIREGTYWLSVFFCPTYVWSNYKTANPMLGNSHSSTLISRISELHHCTRSGGAETPLNAVSLFLRRKLRWLATCASFTAHPSATVACCLLRGWDASSGWGYAPERNSRGGCTHGSIFKGR